MVRGIIIGCLFLLIPVLWYVWLRRVLLSQVAGHFTTRKAIEEGPNIVESLSNFQMRTQQLLALKPNDFTSEVLTKIKDAENKAQYKIERNLRIYYRSSIYINKIFRLDVSIEKESKDPITTTTNEKKKLKITHSERLKFEALEEDPEIKVELKFAEEDFSANKTQEKKKLKKEEETKFSFLLKPLKAEECILTVIVSYVSNVPVPDTIIEKVTINKKIETEGEPKKTEETEQATIKPASTETIVLEVKAIELPISVKCLDGLNVGELELAQKVLGSVVAAILLGIALYTGQIERQDFMTGMLFQILGMAGITVVPEALEKAGLIKTDKPEESVES